MAHIVEFQIEKGQHAGRVHKFDEHDTFIFGRMEDCHVCLANDLYVSRHHFIAEINPPAVRLRDLGSRNGTWVNGSKSGGRSRKETPEQGAGHEYPTIDLKHGDKIQVGDSVIRVCVKHNAQPPVIRPAEELGDISALSPERLAGLLFGGNGKPVKLVIPGHTIERELGRGGFGLVYLGRNNTSGQRVAIKVMLPKTEGDAATVQKFCREVAIAAALRHPRIVSILEHGLEGSTFYFVMEFCEGGNAADAMRASGGRMKTKRALDIACPALEGLIHAHSKGVVHRDIKPQNILLAKGSALLSDFGLSKSFQGAGLSGLTVTKCYAGTPLFMPREQITNFKYVKPVSDVWSMAATIYHLITGAFVYDFSAKRDPIDVLLNESPIPIRKRDASLSKLLADALDHALVVNPKERLGSADALLRTLDKLR